MPKVPPHYYYNEKHLYAGLKLPAQRFFRDETARAIKPIPYEICVT